MLVSSLPFQRPASQVSSIEPAFAPPQVASASNARPCVWATPFAKISTLTGTLLPRLATNVAPIVATGSPQVTVQVTGETYVTWTANESEAWLPVASRAVHVTVVVPTGIWLPLVGEQL